MINFAIFDAVLNLWIMVGKTLALVNYIQTCFKKVPIINLLNRINHFYKHQEQIIVFLSFALEIKAINFIWTSNKATLILSWKKTVMKRVMQLENKIRKKGNKITKLTNNIFQGLESELCKYQRVQLNSVATTKGI